MRFEWLEDFGLELFPAKGQMKLAEDKEKRGSKPWRAFSLDPDPFFG